MSRSTRRRFLNRLLAAGSTSMLSSCVTTPKHADLGKIYNSGAQRDELSRNPIILIPGIMGSYLKDTVSNERIWGVLGGGGGTSRYVEEFAHPMGEGKELSQLRDGVVSDGVLSSLTVSLGARIQVKAYAQLLSALGAGGYRDQSMGESGALDYGDDHYTCFQFDYDWRRSCVENAALLAKFVAAKRSYVEAEHRKRFGVSGNVKFDIVAHSMGGLIARYFQMYGGAPLPANGSLPALTWAGTRELDKVILVAPPNAGSVASLQRLVDGFKAARFVPRIESGLLGTFPSLYELLPRQRHGFVVDKSGANIALLDPEVWKSQEWGLADPRQADTLRTILPGVADSDARRQIALDHQRKCLKNAAQFHAAIDRPAKLPSGASIYLFAGDYEATARSLTVSSGGKITTTGFAPGDYTVTRFSALLDERGKSDTGPLKTPIDWTQITFVSDSHLGLTRNPTFTDNMLHLLLER